MSDINSAMPKRFAGAVVTGKGKLEVREIPGFTPGEYDSVVRIESCSICAATDTHLVDGNFPWRAPEPFVIGHESAGRVIAVGPKVRHFKQGQIVVRPQWYPPGGKLDGLSHCWGGFAQYGIAGEVSYISTGGGAFLEFLEGKTLPAVAALEARG